MSEWNFEFKHIPKTQLESFKELFTGYEDGLVRSEPGGFVMTPAYGRNAKKIYDMQPRTDDVWLLTFPKCGNHQPHFCLYFKAIHVNCFK